MTPESPTLMDRLRAGMAALLTRLAAGARRLEDWSARGMRPLLLGLAVIAVLVVGALAVVGGGRGVLGWHGDGRDRHERSEMRAKPAGKTELRHGGQAFGKPIGRPHGRPEGKPEAPRPPAPPVPEAPAAPAAPTAP